MDNLNHNQKLVSIAMATYNGEKFIVEQIESILAQSYENFELIIVDDCSTDKTVEILNKYKKFKKIKIFHNKERLGIIKNFEKAISLCEGKYIAFSDQDDIWLNSKLEVLVENINDSLLICSDSKLIGENNQIISNSFFRSIKLKIPATEKLYYKVIYESFILGCTMLFDREILNKVIPIPINSNSHDWWITVNSAATGRVKVLDEALLLKRVHPKNIYKFYHDSLLFRLKNFLQGKVNHGRQNRFETGLERINCYLDEQVWRNEEQHLYLKEMKKFYTDMIRKKPHFNATRITYKYRNYIYEGLNPVVKFMHVFMKLL